MNIFCFTYPVLWFIVRPWIFSWGVALASVLMSEPLECIDLISVSSSTQYKREFE